MSDNAATGEIRVSAKREAGDEWEKMRARYPKGRELEVSAVQVDWRGVCGELEPTVVGFIQASECALAGVEYRDFQSNLHSGSFLFVAVSRVVAADRNLVNRVLLRSDLGASR